MRNEACSCRHIDMHIDRHIEPFYFQLFNTLFKNTIVLFFGGTSPPKFRHFCSRNFHNHHPPKDPPLTCRCFFRQILCMQKIQSTEHVTARTSTVALTFLYLYVCVCMLSHSGTWHPRVGMHACMFVCMSQRHLTSCMYASKHVSCAGVFTLFGTCFDNMYASIHMYTVYHDLEQWH